eukprot:TRINITY_DN25238_c0_g1_i1.p1 TRINITY_DN25238_c0_g1~~TRINITY_DN25238_c0_g1_i1.p1  ORF type:complete len:876 (+),score=292.76 TRINITY_DN25238_c0_g1_i1:122-2629(+)
MAAQPPPSGGGSSNGQPPPAVFARLLQCIGQPEAHARSQALHQLPSLAAGGALCDGAAAPDCGGCKAERAGEELLPAIAAMCDDADHLLLGTLAAALAGMAAARPRCNHAAGALALLELLAANEDTSVRQAAAEGVAHVAACGPSARAQANAMLWRHGKSRWGTQRAAAAQLLPLLYAGVPPEEQAEARKLYSALAADPDPVVRRTAAASLGPFASRCRADPAEEAEAPSPRTSSGLVAGRQRSGGLPPTAAGVSQAATLRATVLALWRQLAQDTQDAVRVAAADATAAVCGMLHPAQRAAAVVPVVKEAAADRDWRVRYVCVSRLGSVASALSGGEAAKLQRNCSIASGSAALGTTTSSVGSRCSTGQESSDLAVTDLLPLFTALSKDPVVQVRCIVAENMSSFAATLPPAAVKPLLVVAERLSTDDDDSVRNATAGDVVALAARVGKELTMRRIHPVLLALLNDKVTEVRLHLIRQLGPLGDVVGVPVIRESVWPCVTRLATDKNYRLRESVVTEVAALARSLGPESFGEQLLDSLVLAVGDKAHSVRAVAAEALQSLGSTFGEKWVTSQLLPRLLPLTEPPPPRPARSPAAPPAGPLPAAAGQPAAGAAPASAPADGPAAADGPAGQPPPDGPEAGSAATEAQGTAESPPHEKPLKPAAAVAARAGAAAGGGGAGLADDDMPPVPLLKPKLQGPQPSGYTVWTDRLDQGGGYSYQVRMCAVELIAELAAALPRPVRLEKVYPELQRMVSDGVPNVRCALCRCVFRVGDAAQPPEGAEGDAAEPQEGAQQELRLLRGMLQTLAGDREESVAALAEEAAAVLGMELERPTGGGA